MSNTLTIFTTPPQRERKAVEEIRRAGGRAYLPTEERSHKVSSRDVRRRYPIVPGYVFATDKPYDAVYVRAIIGHVDRTRVARLMLTGRVRKTQRSENPFKPGDTAIMTKGQSDIAVAVISTSGRVCVIAFDMFGKTHQQAISYTKLRPG
jgi:hypothetical protein